MLILTRKIDQAIVIRGNILVPVLGVERPRQTEDLRRRKSSYSAKSSVRAKLSRQR
jgi:hypothetical protein